MDLHRLRCFVAAAEELHFGRAARRLDMLPAAFGRFVRLLEDDLGTRLFERTTRTVVLTEDGAELLRDARRLLDEAAGLRERFRDRARARRSTLRLGAIDSASVGLVPALLNDFREARPNTTVELLEDKSIRLLPRLLSGQLDLAILRPPAERNSGVVFRSLPDETAVVAVGATHRLATCAAATPDDLVGEPLIVPDRRTRPHSHDLVVRLLEQAGHRPLVAQTATEKQTIVRMVAAGLGLAVVPRWTARLKVDGVAYCPLSHPAARLPLAAAWVGNVRDPLRDALLTLLSANVERYFGQG